MRIIFGVAILAWAAAVIMVGCGQSTQSVTDFIPHAEGQTWEYRCSFLHGTSEIAASLKTRWFSGTTDLGGITVQNLHMTEEALVTPTGGINAFALPSSASLAYYHINDTGVYSYGTSSSPAAQSILILPLPLEVGDEWERDYGDVTFYCSAAATELVTVPAGTFDSIKVEVRETVTEEAEWYEWYVEGVGQVKHAIPDILLTTFEGGQVIILTDEADYIEELKEKNF
jgi:hypothetical protein